MRIPLFTQSINAHSNEVPHANPEVGFNTTDFLKNENVDFIVPQCSCGGGKKTNGCTCGNGTTDDYVYAFGNIRVVFPTLSIEKEFYNMAVTDIVDKNRPLDEIAFKYLSRAENLYIAREMNWVFTIKGFIDLFIIRVTTNRSLTSLIEAIAPRKKSVDFDVVIARKNAFARKEDSMGEPLPVITYSQLHTATLKEYTDAIVRVISAEHKSDNDIAKKAGIIIGNALQLTNNTGDMDKYRALNFIVLRYMEFHIETYRLKYNLEPTYDLKKVDAGPIQTFGKRKIMEVIFTYQAQISGATKHYACTLDISEEFPYIVTPWSIYYHGI